MKNLVRQAWKEEDGVLTFEWILLLTMVTIGIVSGLSTVRDAIISELGDVAQAMLALDQSYTISFPLVRRTFATLRMAEFGFFGVRVITWTQTPRRNGLPAKAGDLDLALITRRPLRTS